MKLYGLYDPTEPDEIRYVGITKRTLEARLKAHIGEAASSRERTHKIRWIAKLVRANRLPAARLLAIVEDHEAPRIEQLAIAAYRRTGHNLTNGTEGGERTVYTDGSRSRMSAAAKLVAARPGDRELRSQRLKAVAARPGERERRSAALSAAAARPEVREKLRALAARPEVRAKKIAASMAYWALPGARERQSEMMKLTASHPMEIERRSAVMKALWADPEKREQLLASCRSRAKSAAAARWARPRAKEKASAAMKAAWGRENKWRRNE